MALRTGRTMLFVDESVSPNLIEYIFSVASIGMQHANAVNSKVCRQSADTTPACGVGASFSAALHLFSTLSARSFFTHEYIFIF